MIPEINQILFYLNMLFAVNTVFVSEQASIVIDLANKKGQIEYIDLTTPRKGTELAEAGLKEISEATDFDQYFTQLD